MQRKRQRIVDEIKQDLETRKTAQTVLVLPPLDLEGVTTISGGGLGSGESDHSGSGVFSRWMSLGRKSSNAKSIKDGNEGGDDGGIVRSISQKVKRLSQGLFGGGNVYDDGNGGGSSDEEHVPPMPALPAHINASFARDKVQLQSSDTTSPSTTAAILTTETTNQPPNPPPRTATASTKATIHRTSGWWWSAWRKGRSMSDTSSLAEPTPTDNNRNSSHTKIISMYAASSSSSLYEEEGDTSGGRVETWMLDEGFPVSPSSVIAGGPGRHFSYISSPLEQRGQRGALVSTISLLSSVAPLNVSNDASQDHKDNGNIRSSKAEAGQFDSTSVASSSVASSVLETLARTAQTEATGTTNMLLQDVKTVVVMPESHATDSDAAVSHGDVGEE